MSLDVGSVKGSIVVGDEFSATFAALDVKIAKLQSDFDSLSAKVKDHSNKTKVEVDKVKEAYNKLAGSLDPVIAGEQKLAKAQDTLSAALAKGHITQQQHNDLLEKAKEKYKNLENPLGTLKGKISELTEVVARFGGEAGEGLSRISTGLAELVAKGSLLGPVALGLGAVVAAALAISAGVKLADWFGDVIKEGVETEGVISQLNATLKINGSNSGLSAKQMVEFAEDLQFTTKATKEQIIATETQLSRFSGIGSNFREITKLTLDLAAAKHIDAETIVRQLGPAMDGSTKSLRALKEEGIVFQPSQLKTMQALIDGGHAAEFQAKLIELLKGKVEGLAEAQKDKLAVQTANVGKVYKEFKEAIASEVIPALEDSFKVIIDQVGGWETLKLTVQSIGHDIGDVVRRMVYGIAVYLEQSWADWRRFEGAINEGFAALFDGTAKAADVMSTIPGYGAAWIGIAANARKAGAELHLAAIQNKIDMYGNLEAIGVLNRKMAEHHQAMEGDAKVEGKHANQLDDIKGKQKEILDVLIDLDKAYRSLSESVSANTQKSRESLDESQRLLKAALQGTEALAHERAVIALDREERARLAEVNKQLTKARDEEQNAIAKLDQALKVGKITRTQYSDELAKAQSAEFAVTAEIHKSSDEITRNAKEIKLNDAVMQDHIEWDKRAKAAQEAWGKEVGATTLEIIKLKAELDRKVSAVQVEFIDWKSQGEFAQSYGKDLESIYSRYGLLSKASEQLAIQQEIRQRVEAALAKNPDISDTQIARIGELIKANHDAIDKIKADWAQAEIGKWVTQPILDGVEQYKQAGVDAFNTWLETGKFDAESFKKQFLDITIKLIEEWLKRWFAAIAARNVADQASSFSGGGGGGTGGIFQGVFSAGAKYGTSSGSGASASSLAGYLLIAYAAFVVYKGFFEDTKVRAGEASIAAQSATIAVQGSSRYSAQAETAIRSLMDQVKDLASQWHLGLQDLTTGSVSIAINNRGDIVVKTLIDSVGKVFHDMASALDYAKVEALKFAQYSKDTSALVQEAIRDSPAIDTAGLQRDIDFATRLATQNLPDIARGMHDAVQQFTDDFKRALELFGPGLHRSLSDFAQLGPATSSVLAAFSTSLWGFYDQLTGHKEDAAKLAELQRTAYNAQRAIIIAQIILLIEETKARIAAYLAQRDLYGGPGIPGSGGGGLERPPRNGPGDPNEGTGVNAGKVGKGGGPLPTGVPPPPPDPRNPNNDPRIAALIQVLDNLARALQGLPPEIGPGGVKLPGSGGGRSGAGGASTLDDLRKMIDDVNRSVAQSKLSALAKQIDDINKKWDDEIEKLGGNSKALERAKKAHDDAIKAANGNKDAIDKANAAYQKQLAHISKTKEALDAANAARAAEIALAKQQATDKLREELRPVTSEFGLSSWMQKQQDNLRLYQQQLKDAAGTGVPKWLVEQANKNREIQLAHDALGSLGLPLNTTRSEIKALADTIGFLAKSVKEGNLTTKEFNDSFAQLVDQNKSSLYGLAETLAQTIEQSTGDSTKAQQIKAKMDEIAFNIQKAQFNILLTEYEKLGTITGKDKDDLEALRIWLNEQHPDFSGVPLAKAQENLTQATDTFSQAVAQFKQATDSLLQSFNSIFGSTNQLGGSAQDRLAIAQQQFKSIEQGALAGDVTARGKYGAAAENYLNVLSEANAGGALFGAERDRLKTEFQTLLAQTRFTLNGVSYDSGLGAPITPVNVGVGGQPNVGGYTGPVVSNPSGGGGGSLSSDVSGVLQQILTAMITGNANTTPALNSISNNTAKATTSTQTVNANLDRLIAAVYQWLNAA